MRNLAVRLALAGLFVVACGVAAYLLWMNESRARSDSQAFRTFDEAALTAGRETLDLRAAQQAYVAAGQGEPFWIQKAAALTASLRETMTTLRAAARSPEAQSAVDNAASALEDFEQMDRRARDYARSGSKLLASDLIFADGLEIIGGIAGSIDQARNIESQARDARTTAVRRIELAASGSAAAIGVVVVLLLVSVPRRLAVVSPAAMVTPPSPAAASDTVRRQDLPLALDRRISSEPAPPPAAPAPSVDFSTIAWLCVDLARLDDTRALPSLLERAAAVLDAPGIVLWIADPDGRELSPIVTHGYPQSLVTRLGTILSGAENATASAFRTALMQTVRADAASNGAIAAPLVTPAGCVGVMAAEVRDQGEQDPAKLAAATIVAAQLATLVGPPSTRAQVRTEAV
jgi:hypothetical protein